MLSDSEHQVIQELDLLEESCQAIHKQLQQVRDQVQLLLEHTENTDTILDKLTERDVSVWTQPTRLPANMIPPFIPILSRPLREQGVSTRLISLINLKGGVGKTTITANLAAAFASGNYKYPDNSPGKPLNVLVVDLDFQGTLTQRCVTDHSLQEATKNRATAAVLLSPIKPKGEVPHELTVPFLHQPQKAHVIPADDQLDTEDFKRQAALAFGVRETRFAYRSWFHREKIFKSYDLVLFDCPPRLTTSTVCSMTAADFVFIPTSPDAFDIHAVNRTINWIGSMQKVLDLPVRVAGIILNRTNKQGTLSKGEEAKKSDLEGYMKEFLLNNPGSDCGKRPFILKNHLPRRTGEQDSINGRPGECLPGENKDYFAELASEIYERIY